MNKQLLTGLLGLALGLGITSSAWAADFARTITLGSTMTGNINVQDLHVGDDVTLTLVNPTNQALTFHSDAAFGAAENWTVPAHSQRVINFAYSIPFSNDISYTVNDAAGVRIANGVLFDVPGVGVSLGVANTDNLDNGMVIDTFSRTITLGPSVGANFAIDDLGIGDKVQLTLVNPTNQPLTFSTTQMLGPERSWTIPANSQQTVSFTYDRPFSDTVSFQVMGPSNAIVSQGTLFAGPVAVQSGSSSTTTVQQSSTTSSTTSVQSQQVERSETVRGFW